MHVKAFRLFVEITDQVLDGRVLNARLLRDVGVTDLDIVRLSAHVPLEGATCHAKLVLSNIFTFMCWLLLGLKQIEVLRARLV